MRRLSTPLVALLAAALLAPATALAGPGDDYQDVYRAFQATGTVDGCAFTAKKLASAKQGVPPDVDTYAPDFPDALDAALRQRAGGDCEEKPKSTGGGTDSATPSGSGSSSTPSAAPATPATPAAPAAGAAPAAAAASPSGASGAAGAVAASTTTPAPAPEVAAAPGASDGSVASAASRTAGATGADDAPFPLVLLAVLAALALLAGLLWALARFFALDPPWLAAGRHATAEAGWRASASWSEFSDWVRLGR